MPIRALCATCKTRPAVQATRPLRCRQCLADEAVARKERPPRPRPRRRAMRDWQRPIERR